MLPTRGYAVAMDDVLAISEEAQLKRRLQGLPSQSSAQSLIYSRLNFLERRCYQNRAR